MYSTHAPVGTIHGKNNLYENRYHTHHGRLTDGILIFRMLAFHIDALPITIRDQAKFTDT